MRGAASARALLFDLDGTLIDSDHLHYEAFLEVFPRHGATLDLAGFRAHVSGAANAVVAARYLPHVPAAGHAAIMDEKEAAYRARLVEAAPLPGLPAFLDWAEAAGFRLGLVTNAPRANAAHVLGLLGLEGRFETLVIGGELARSKPDPLPYLTGLARLGAAAAGSIAFEDSDAGLRSARAAGLPVVGLATTLDAEGLRARGAALAIADYEDARLRAFVAGLG